MHPAEQLPLVDPSLHPWDPSSRRRPGGKGLILGPAHFPVSPTRNRADGALLFRLGISAPGSAIGAGLVCRFVGFGTVGVGHQHVQAVCGASSIGRGQAGMAALCPVPGDPRQSEQRWTSI
jgi:hypothetical protein